MRKHCKCIFFLKKKELQIIERERKTNTNRQSIGFQMMKDKIRKKINEQKKVKQNISKPG
jgi:hypothetical protein